MWTADLSDVDDRRPHKKRAEPEPDELIEHSTTLDHWVDTDNVTQKLGHLQVRDDEIVCIRDTDEDDLVNSEYEGYMGNYGETLDYWYRRAAVVLWPQSSELLQQFDLDFDKALKALEALACQPAQAAKVLNTVQVVKSRLRRFQSEDAQRSLTRNAGLLPACQTQHWRLNCWRQPRRGCWAWATRRAWPKCSSRMARSFAMRCSRIGCSNRGLTIKSTVCSVNGRTAMQAPNCGSICRACLRSYRP